MDAPAPSPPTILVVEDHPDVREMTAQLCEVAGFRVATAPNGAEALAWLRSNPRPALVLLDLMMPVMDGLEFRRHQLADPALADLAVVLLTASDPNSWETLPGLAVLIKPFDLASFERVLAPYRGVRSGS